MTMNEKQGAAEWLRGIIDECDANKTHCSAIAEAFGIDCWREKTCRGCIAKMMTAIAYRIDLDMVGYERLKKENAELKAELADWKGNAEGFQPDAYMKLPLDADGVPIRIGDIVYRDDDPEPSQVDLIYAGSTGYCTVRLKDSAGIYTSADAPRLSHKKPEPPDSWEKLEKDARKTACDYAPAPRDEDGLTTCDGCPFLKSESCSNEMTIDLVERAKKLAGIEEEARND